MTRAGVAVIVIEPFTKRVLLLHRKLHWSGWEYAKGGIEAGESTETAARREVAEETGLALSALHPLPVQLIFQDHDTDRSCEVFLGLSKGQEVTLSLEHDDSQWVTFSEAKTLLAFPDQIPPLEAAETFIKEHL